MYHIESDYVPRFLIFRETRLLVRDLRPSVLLSLLSPVVRICLSAYLQLQRRYVFIAVQKGDREAHINHDVLTPQLGRPLNLEDFYVLRQQLDSQSVKYHTRFQSLLRRVIELENRLGVRKSGRSLRRERIQLGLEVSVAGEHNIYAPGLPFMMILLAFIATMAPITYKYVISAYKS